MSTRMSLPAIPEFSSRETLNTPANTFASVSELRQVLTNLQVQSCPYVYNFHLHTISSDGRLTALGLCEQAVELNLQGFAITDHHTLAGYRVASAWLQQRQQEHPENTTPILWSGIEINAELLDTEVHILGYGFDPEHPALLPYTQGQAATGADLAAQRVIGAIHEAGGLAVLAHPARYKQPAAALIPAAADLGIDGVETFYCYGNPKVWAPSPQQTQEVAGLAARHQLLSTCGTDTHGLDIIERL